jgi:hypothetical protein
MASDADRAHVLARIAQSIHLVAIEYAAEPVALVIRYDLYHLQSWPVASGS